MKCTGCVDNIKKNFFLILSTHTGRQNRRYVLKLHGEKREVVVWDERGVVGGKQRTFLCVLVDVVHSAINAQWTRQARHHRPDKSNDTTCFSHNWKRCLPLGISSARRSIDGSVPENVAPSAARPFASSRSWTSPLRNSLKTNPPRKGWRTSPPDDSSRLEAHVSFDITSSSTGNRNL
jgi:hypothetical protein